MTRLPFELHLTVDWGAKLVVSVTPSVSVVRSDRSDPARVGGPTGGPTCTPRSFAGGCGYCAVADPVTSACGRCRRALPVAPGVLTLAPCRIVVSHVGPDGTPCTVQNPTTLDERRAVMRALLEPDDPEEDWWRGVFHWDLDDEGSGPYAYADRVSPRAAADPPALDDQFWYRAMVEGVCACHMLPMSQCPEDD